MKNTILVIGLLFYYGDTVIYPVPEFYKKTCSGIGIVKAQLEAHPARCLTCATTKEKYLVNTRCVLGDEWFQVQDLKRVSR